MNAVTSMAVHTHTHTHTSNIINKINIRNKDPSCMHRLYYLRI